MADVNISVIIPSYNSQKTIGLSLSALLNQKCDIVYEVIVVDSSPGDRVDNIVSQYPGVIFIKKTTRLNPGEGRNIGAEKAKGGVLVFLDADVAAEPDTLQKIWFYYRKGFKVFNGTQEFMPYPRFSLFSFLEYCYFQHEFQKGRRLTERKILNTALLVFDKNLFLQEGGFKNIPRMQDTELARRLHSKNVKLFFIPEIVSHIIYETDLEKLIKKLFINGINVYYIKYRDVLSSTGKVIFRIAVPMLVFVKTMRVIVHNICYNGFKDKTIAVVMSPIIFLCSICWMIGLCNALIYNRGISTER